MIACPITASYGKQVDSSDTSKGPPNLVIAPPLTSNPYGDHESREGLLIAHSLRADGLDASEDGTGRGIPLISVSHDPACTLTAREYKGPLPEADLSTVVVFDPNQVTSPGNYSNPKAGDPRHPLVSAAPPMVAFSCKDSGNDAGDVSPTLRGMNAVNGNANAGGQVAVAFQEAQTGCREYPEAGALRANGPGHDPVGTRIRLGMSVRRLTPRECERLQGFEDDYTAITYKNKPAADGPRYKAIGNSMCVDVLEDILRRIGEIDPSRPPLTFEIPAPTVKETKEVEG